MIDVAVRDQDNINLADIRTQCLLSKVGGGVDEDGLAVVFDEDGNPETLILRIVGKARRTVACDRRHACGCSEKR